MIFCLGDELVGVGTTPHGAYDDYKRTDDLHDPLDWNECTFYEGEEIKIREKKKIVQTTKTELVKVQK